MIVHTPPFRYRIAFLYSIWMSQGQEHCFSRGVVNGRDNGSGRSRKKTEKQQASPPGSSCLDAKDSDVLNVCDTQS